jgi:aspartate/methionine/tyrosine aminotransferase
MPTVQELAERISWISESSTMKVAAEADRQRREGVDVVDFSAGEPDFPTPDNIKNAAVEALRQNFTKYTPVSGTVELKQTIATITSAATARRIRPKSASRPSAASTRSSTWCRPWLIRAMRSSSRSLIG